MTWVWLALLAGSFQTLRNALASSLARQISPWLNSWSRFAFNLPLSGSLVLYLGLSFGWPRLTASFLLYCALTGITQLLANVLLIAAFRVSNFAQSIVFHKLEVVFTGVIGVLLFSESPSALGWAGLVVCALGSVSMNLGRAGEGGRGSLHFDRGGLLALSCGLLLVFASFFLKDAVRALAAANPELTVGGFRPAVYTLFHTTWIEVVLLSLGIAVTRPGQWRAVPRHLGRLAAIGAASFSGSVCWFWAYSMALVAYVKAVGQIEAVLSVVVAIVIFRQREVLRQLPGVGLVLAGILLVLFG